jgi:oxalate---CoA ligase
LQGLENPTKKDRRFFNTRVKELIDEGLVELVEVRATTGTRSKPGEAWIKCLRLVQREDSQAMDVDESGSMSRHGSIAMEEDDG